MFLKIMSSNEPYYVNSKYHSSDIPGDTTKNVYGYGSYTSNYKNYACRYLSKIYIEEKKYDKALYYIKLADKKHVSIKSCGTGNFYYRNEINGIYALCYEGLGQYDKIITLLLPSYYEYEIGILIRAIKKTYSQTEINNYLSIAEKSIVCETDKFKSTSYITHNYGEENEVTTTIKYTSGSATINLFGKQITLKTPSLNNGECVSNELFLNQFKNSSFYIALCDTKN